MSWIRQHWDDDYVANAERVIKETVSLELHYLSLLLMMQLPLRWPSIARKPERSGATPTVTNPVCSAVAPSYMSLAEAYGLTNMQIGTSDDVEGQTVEQEYQAYITTALSKPGTDMLKFWEVSTSA